MVSPHNCFHFCSNHKYTSAQTLCTDLNGRRVYYRCSDQIWPRACLSYLLDRYYSCSHSGPVSKIPPSPEGENTLISLGLQCSMLCAVNLDDARGLPNRCNSAPR